MLVLSRREQEVLEIGPNITVQVLRISGGRVRLGVRAPKELMIARQESPRLDVPVDQSGNNSDSFEKTDS